MPAIRTRRGWPVLPVDCRVPASETRKPRRLGGLKHGLLDNAENQSDEYRRESMASVKTRVEPDLNVSGRGLV
jgi:hypothetical protein